MIERVRNLPAWARWALYAAIGVMVLTIVQSGSDTGLLTSEPTARQMLRWAVPIFLAGLGGLYSERAGIVNIGLEGMLVLGMWFGAWGSIEFGAWWGLAFGMFGGALGGLLHAVATVTFGVDHIISGVAINILTPAAARYLSQEVWDTPTTSPTTSAVGTWDIPFLAGGSLFGWETPDLLGRIVGWDWWVISDIAALMRGVMRNTSWVGFIALALVPFTAWLLWRTRFGLRLRISGENPYAGESQGVPILRYRYVAVLISGALAGLGGAFISTELSPVYQQGNSAGRGFIGLAALIFGNWRPGGVLMGSLLFGYVFGLNLTDLDGTASRAMLLVNAIALAGVLVWALVRQRRVDAILAGVLAAGALSWYVAADSVPDWWSNVLPYVLVLLVLVFFAQRLRPPAFAGQIYRKGER